MKKFLRATYILVAVFATYGGASAQQTIGENSYKIPPAMTGANGKVFIGTQRGTILVATSTSTDITITDSITTKDKLPAEVDAIWNLTMPPGNANQVIVGLVSYKLDSATRKYGVLRSTDFGQNWTLLKPAALSDTPFVVSNGYWDFGILDNMLWLADGMHGWIYGLRGLVGTNDGGLTWQKRYTTRKRPDSDPSAANEELFALAFADATNGVSCMGSFGDMYFRHTSDGGVTWTDSSASPGYNQSYRINAIGNQYRALVIDSHAPTPNGYLDTPSTAKLWKPKVFQNVTSLFTNNSEILWAGINTGYLMQPSGEIWQTLNGGKTNWTLLKAADPNMVMPLDVNHGFGYTDIILDSSKIVQVSTLKQTGEIYKLIQWSVTIAAVPGESNGGQVQELSVYPNPASNNLALRFNSSVKGIGRLSVTNAAGELVQSEQITAVSGENKISVNTSELATGAYFAEVRIGGTRLYVPFAIAR